MDEVEKQGIARLIGRDQSTITVEIFGQKEVYEYLEFREFTSETKSMSVVVKNVKSGKILSFWKGASDFANQYCIENDI